MKAADGFAYRKMQDVGVIVPVGRKPAFHGMVTLNETGALLWERLRQETDRAALIEALTQEYETDRETAARDVDAFLSRLREAGLLTE